MADFRFTVDTEPMADSIDRVAYHVDGVTTAVVAMQTAVVIAEQRAAESVCQNLDKGFYTLIRSQISQKIAKLRSDVDSKLMEMAQQTVTLKAIKSRMERDYMMIANRYMKLFGSLNNNLRIRIFELDKDTAKFVTQDIESITNRLGRFLGSVSTNQSESVGSSQVIASSKTKGLGYKVVEAMHLFISDIKQQKYRVSRILAPEKGGKNFDCYIPVMIAEYAGKGASQNQVKFSLPKAGDAVLNSILDKSINNAIMSSIDKLSWVEADREEKDKVNAELNQLIAKADCSERVKKQINQLHSANSWQKLQ